MNQRFGALTRHSALVVLLAGGLALGLAGLLAAQVCLLTLLLIVVVGVLVPLRIPSLADDSPQRTGVALLALALLVLATALSGPAALTSGRLKGDLGLAASSLALPTAVPIGLLAALAAGALVAVALEISDRRGVQSALVLGIAVLGLASVAAPGRHLLPVIVLGWPAALFTLTRLAAPVELSVPEPAAAETLARPDELGRPEAATRPDRLAGRLGRWHLLPVLAAIMLSCSVLAAAVLTGLVTSTVRPGGDSARTIAGAGLDRSTSDYLGGDLDLSTRGSLGSEAFLQVPGGSPRLWRAGTLDRYTGRGWLTTEPTEGLPRLQADAPDQLTVLPALPATGSVGSRVATAEIQTDQVHLLRPGQTQVLAPGRLISFSSPALTGGSAFSLAGDRLTIAGTDGGLNQYQVRTQVLPMVDDPAAASRLLTVSANAPAAPGSDGGNPRWTALPSTVPDRVRQLGLRLVSTAPSRQAAVQAVERELASRISYNLDSPVPPADADAVDNVLFSSLSGFCEQFASAEVVLLRAAGVPARMAVGFAGDEPASAGVRTLKRSDAHAWVEVWFPGVGWVSSDPTPAGAASSSWWQSTTSTLRSLVAAPSSWLAVLLLALLFGGSSGLGRRRPSTSITGPELGRRLAPELAAAFGRLEAELAARGQGRAPHETVAVLARRLPARFPPALAVLERGLYAPVPLSQEESQAAAAALNRSLDDVPDG